MRKLSLFSGVGGIDLAAHWAGMETVAFCEREPFPVKVLQKNFPGTPIYDDVCTLTAERLKEDGLLGDGRTIDIISAGFPCQPFSHAGNRKGADDERYLWPEVVRVVADIRPTWFVGENVAGLLSMAEPTGGTTVESRVIARESDEDFYEAVYTQQEIMLIGRICQDLKDIGYEVQVYVLPAASVGASHRRDRTFILGNTTSQGFQERRRSNRPESAKETGARLVTELERSGEALADTNIIGCMEGKSQKHSTKGWEHAQRGLTISGENVAHYRGAGCEECNFTTITNEQRHVTGCNDQIIVAHTDSKPGLQTDSSIGTIGSGRESRDDVSRSGRAQSAGTGGRSAQPRMGGNADELSTGMDGRGIDSLDDLIEFIHSYPQPALMGMPQYDWEPPRVATGVQDRTGRLKALGNAVDPLQIYPFMAAIKAINDQLRDTKEEGA